ncbi:MAG: hypothetical protein HFE52_06090 [Clostridia bacterium]|nr:hypothetical protein [Clostridia bacterium]
MDLLYECASKYGNYAGCDYTFFLDCGIDFTVAFNKSHFYHLIGLHKLTDIAQLKKSQYNSANSIYRNIMNGHIKFNDIVKSLHYNEIASRLQFFTDIYNIVNSKVIIDFDYTKVQRTSILANYILFKDYGEMKAHCGFAYDRNGKDRYYPETFFVQDNDYYIKNQDVYSVVDIKVEKYR